jgi:ATP-dependent exoDNAse (exonuclease V) alpha subunit
MLQDEIAYQILHTFRFEPTAGQRAVTETFARFLTDRNPQVMMVLRGSAGTGKTSLAGAMVRTLKALRQKVVLLAPTGRAAKVFSQKAGVPAFTIHRKIYRQKAMMGEFSLNMNAHQDTLFMVDEASMIANAGSAETPFGSGRLLDDLVQFVYGGRNCRLMLIGDKAQLPPVGEEESPALSTAYLEGYGMTVYDCDLNEVLRQSLESGILWNATKIRQIVPSPSRSSVLSLPRIQLNFPDVQVVSGDELIETLASSYSKVGIDETMVVTRSNKRANIYNQGIRNMILGREEELTRGDLLMVVKNNYSLTPDPQPSTFSFIANGDMAVVQRVRRMEELYGFRFAEVTVQFPDYDGYELTAKVLLDTLTAEAPALTREQHAQLFERVMEDYAYITRKRDRMEKLKTDPYYNALQVKYGYAVTCHKAQGGQWAHVYIDQGYMTDDMLSPDYIHWLYTAFTRATEHIYLVNWHKSQIETTACGKE